MKQWTLGKPEIHRFLKIQTRGRRTLQRWKTMVDDKKVARNEDVSMDSHKLYIYTYLYYIYIFIYTYLFIHIFTCPPFDKQTWLFMEIDENE